MNNKRMFNALLIGTLFILGAIFVSGQNVVISIETPGSNANLNQTTNLNFNITGGKNITNFTVNVYNSANVLVFSNFTNTSIPQAGNLSNATHDPQRVISINFSDAGFSDGTYTINISTVENSTTTNNINSTLLTVKVDKTLPKASIVAKDIGGVTLTSTFGFGSQVDIDCGTAVDVTSGLNTSVSSISVVKPGTNDEENITIKDNSVSVLKGFIGSTGTEKLGTYSFKCVLKDNAGNFNISVLNLTSEPVVVDSSPFVDPNFVSPIAKKVIGKGTVENFAGKYGEIPDVGVSRLIKKLGAITLLIAGEEHTIKVEELGDDSVTLMISSEPFNVEMKVGDIKEVDVNGDGVNDLEIFFNKVHQKSADLVFKEISTPVVPIKEEVVDVVPPTPPVVTVPTEKKDYTWILTLLGMVVIAAILMFIIHHFSRKGDDEDPGGSKVKFTPRDLGSTREETPWGSGKEKGPFY